MKRTILIIGVVAVIVSLVFAGVALAVSQSTIDEILADAADGTIDGNWTAEEIEAAIAYILDNALEQQYGDVLASLESYLASIEGSDAASGSGLAYTGAPILMALIAGGGLIGGGLLLRRRSR